MPTQKKIDTVEALKDRINRATLTVTTNYRGLRVQEMDQLRRRLRAASVEVRVAKNNLVRLAAGEAGVSELMSIVEGPTALVFGYDDAVAAAKAISEYAQTAPAGFAIRGALMEGNIITAADLRSIMSLPPKPVMLAQLAGQLQSPLAMLLALLDAPLRELSSLLGAVLSDLPGLIEARTRQLETTG